MATSNTTITLEVEGDMGHGSRPDEIKRHSIYAAIELLDAIRALLPDAKLEVQTLSTGTQNSPNQFPRTCLVKCTVSDLDTPGLARLDTFIAEQSRVSRI